jgi:hypothetical protein
MKCTFEMGSEGTIYISSFMKIGKGAEGILRFLLSSLQGSNIDKRDL